MAASSDKTMRVRLQRWDYLVAAMAALVALLVYVRTLPPTFTGGDSAELITAAYTLGIAHPPGYPLFCLLGKLFTLIVPFNTIAWRVAFMSAFFGASTCFVVSLLITKVTGKWFAGLAGAVMLAVSSEFWKWSVVVETYTLNAFLMVLCILALLVWQETRRSKYLYLFAVAYGLGLCNHHTMHFMGPVFALFILSVDHRPWQRWQVYAWVTVIGVGIWGLIHLYLPLRAMAGPYSNWGNPQTWENFWYVVTRAQYGYNSQPFTIAHFLEQMGLFASRYVHQFTMFGAALPLLGIYPLWKRNRYMTGLVVGTGIYIVVGISLITNFPFDMESIWLNTKFWVPAYVMAAVLAGCAVAWITSLKLGRMMLSFLSVPLIAGMFVFPLTAHYRNNDKSDYYFARDFGMNILKTLDQDALYFPTTDHFVYPVFYLQAVEGLRPDVNIVTKYGPVEERYYEEMPAALRGGNTGRVETKVEKAAVIGWIVANSGRPAFFSRGHDISGYRDVSAGLLYKAVPIGKRLPEIDYWGHYEWHGLEVSDARGDMTAVSILADYHFARGRDFFQRGKRDEALEEMEQAVRIAPTRRDLINNLAGICSNYGEYAAAERYFLMVLDIDPYFRISLVNLANIYQGTRQYEKAKHCLQRIIAIDQRRYGNSDPYVTLAVNDLGGVYLVLEDFDAARKSFEWVLSVCRREFGVEHPYTLRAMSNLAVVLRAQGEWEAARKHRKRAIETLSRLVGKDHPFTNLARMGVFIPSGE